MASPWCIKWKPGRNSNRRPGVYDLLAMKKEKTMFQGQNVTELDVGGLLGLLTAQWKGTDLRFPEAPTGVHLRARASEQCCNGCHSEDWCGMTLDRVQASEQCCNGAQCCFGGCHSGGKVETSQHCCNGCHSEDWCAVPRK